MRRAFCFQGKRKQLGEKRRHKETSLQAPSRTSTKPIMTKVMKCTECLPGNSSDTNPSALLNQNQVTATPVHVIIMKTSGD